MMRIQFAIHVAVVSQTPGPCFNIKTAFPDMRSPFSRSFNNIVIKCYLSTETPPPPPPPPPPPQRPPPSPMVSIFQYADHLSLYVDYKYNDITNITIKRSTDSLVFIIVIHTLVYYGFFILIQCKGHAEYLDNRMINTIFWLSSLTHLIKGQISNIFGCVPLIIIYD